MINYNKMITKKEFMDLKQTEFEKLKAIALQISKKVKDKIEIKIKKYYKFKNGRYELTKCVVASQNYENIARVALDSDEFSFTQLQKIIIHSNVSFSNETLFFQILFDNGISFEILEETINKIGYIKYLNKLKEKANKLGKAENLDNEIDKLTRYTYNAKVNLERICNIIKHYYSIDNYNIIIARLIQIVVFEKDVYINIEPKTAKTP